MSSPDNPYLMGGVDAAPALDGGPRCAGASGTCDCPEHLAAPAPPPEFARMAESLDATIAVQAQTVAEMEAAIAEVRRIRAAAPRPENAATEVVDALDLPSWKAMADCHLQALESLRSRAEAAEARATRSEATLRGVRRDIYAAVDHLEKVPPSYDQGNALGIIRRAGDDIDAALCAAPTQTAAPPGVVPVLAALDAAAAPDLRGNRVLDAATEMHFAEMALDRGEVRAIDRDQDRRLTVGERINLLVMEVRHLRAALAGEVAP